MCIRDRARFASVCSARSWTRIIPHMRELIIICLSWTHCRSSTCTWKSSRKASCSSIHWRSTRSYSTTASTNSWSVVRSRSGMLANQRRKEIASSATQCKAIAEIKVLPSRINPKSVLMRSMRLILCSAMICRHRKWTRPKKSSPKSAKQQPWACQLKKHRQF